MVRFFDAEVTGLMWELIAHFLRDAWSQVQLDTDLSEPWQDSGVAPGRVLNPCPSTSWWKVTGHPLDAKFREAFRW